MIALIEEVAQIIRDLIALKGQTAIALSGGSRPIPLYQGLASQNLEWAQVSVTLIDDRLVPPHHPHSNQKLVAEMLIQNEAEDARFIPLQDWKTNKIPDLAILGMGNDGHIASLFPDMLKDQNAFNPNAKPAILTTPPKGDPLHPRITMNLAMILAIPKRILIIPSDGKKAVLENALNNTDLPITRLLAYDGTQISYTHTS